jgi:hypothetical protein
MSIPQAVRSRLAQLLRLLLSATQAGEIVAAQGATNRTLGASGLDLHILADAVDGRPARDRHPLDDDQDKWRDKVVYASVHADLLNDWEKGFIENLMGWSGSPTPKQMERIEIIYNKVRARAPK